MSFIFTFIEISGTHKSFNIKPFWKRRWGKAMNRRVQACCWRKSENVVQGKWEKVPNTLSTGRRVVHPDANDVRHYRHRRREQAPACRHQDPERFRPTPPSLLKTRHPLFLLPERRSQQQT